MLAIIKHLLSIKHFVKIVYFGTEDFSTYVQNSCFEAFLELGEKCYIPANIPLVLV